MTVRGDMLKWVAAGMLCLALAHCTTSPEEKAREWAATLEHRLTREWILQAKVIALGGQTVYFHGEAEVGPELPLIGWAGNIKGEVLIVTAKTATVCTDVTITPDGAVHLPVDFHTETREPPNSWEYLVAK